MMNFLRTYTKIPNKFIDDFYFIADQKYGNKDIVINIDTISKWLQVSKHSLKVLIQKNFTEYVDYTITKIQKFHKDAKGSTMEEIILVSPDCFKQICMLSKSDNAIETRMFYLQLEDLILKYHYTIEDNLKKKIDMLENNQKPKTNIKSGVIYFFEALNVADIDIIDYEFNSEKKKFIKIGETTDTKNRFNNYNSGTVHDIKPLLIIEVDNVKQIEKCIKNVLLEYQYRKKKEIYFIDIDTIKAVIELCEDMLRGFVKYKKRNGNKKFVKSYSTIQKNGGAAIFIKINE